jgi:hypothetical protein
LKEGYLFEGVVWTVRRLRPDDSASGQGQDFLDTIGEGIVSESGQTKDTSSGLDHVNSSKVINSPPVFASPNYTNTELLPAGIISPRHFSWTGEKIILH